VRLVFAGTPEFARAALHALGAAGFEIALVLTQPDRPAGRGLKLHASPVKQLALAQGWPLAQPRSLRLNGKYPEDAAAAQAALQAARADAMVVAAYGLILPQWTLDTFAPPRGLGCLNIHASVLPRWRGAAPIQRAIEAGDTRSGVTLMQMDAGLDTGDILLTETLDIGQDSAAQLHDRLAALGARLIVQALRRAETGALPGTPQPVAGITYAHKIEKHEARIDWTQPAERIARRIRAFDPFPGASAILGTETLKLWAASAQTIAPSLQTAHPGGRAEPGTLLEATPAGVLIAAGGASALRVHELQRPGGKRLSAADFLRGFPLAPGQRFEA
jgi:methionyl-tRNA formyltransferase